MKEAGTLRWVSGLNCVHFFVASSVVRAFVASAMCCDFTRSGTNSMAAHVYRNWISSYRFLNLFKSSLLRQSVATLSSRLAEAPKNNRAGKEKHYFVRKLTTQDADSTTSQDANLANLAYTVEWI